MIWVSIQVLPNLPELQKKYRNLAVVNDLGDTIELVTGA